MTNGPKILVVGSMNMDLMVYGMSKIPNFGESVSGKSYCYSIGGKGGNQAYACAMMGANTYMVGRVGNDDFGHQIIRNLKKAGIETKYILLDDEKQTGFDPILVNPDGKYISVVVMGANNFVSPQDVKRILDEEHFDMILVQLEIPIETVYRTYEMAVEKHIPVFLDAGPAMSIPLERLKGIFIISPNEIETKALTGIDISTNSAALKAAKLLFDKVAPHYVLLKLGARGALVYDGKHSEIIPTFNTKVLDTTSAGDTFGAATAVQLCKGKSMREAVIFANAAATLCVSRRGAQSSIPRFDEVNMFLKSSNIVMS